MQFSTFKVMLVASSLLLATPSFADKASLQAIKAAITHPDRPASDAKDDAKRKPEAIMNYFDIKPGSTVLDVLAGSGYYSEMLSRVVGEQGKVIIHNDKHFLKYYGTKLAKRLDGGKRLSNAERIDISLNTLDLAENSVDTIFIILGYHDFYYIFSETEIINVPKVLAKFKKFLKPGGTIAIVDHEAVKGAPASVGNTLHRIDPQLVKADMKKAGFTLDGELSILQNSTDDKAKKIWDIPGRQTSRFVMRFKNVQ
jgi:predicted methyltransferase